MEPENYHHVLLTRFNVLWSDKVPFRGRDPQWLEDRFELFDRYCFPSVMGQTCQNFVWFVFFDSQTPEPFMSRVAQYTQRYPRFVPIFVDRFSAEVFVTALGERGFLERDYIVTSRVDNDDALAKDYIHRVQKWVRNKDPQEPTFLNFCRGCAVVGRDLFLTRDYRSHFASLVESSQRPITVYRNHMEMEKWGRVEQLYGTPAWLEVRHPNRLTAYHVLPSWMPLPRTLGKLWFPGIEDFELFCVRDAVKYPYRLLCWVSFRLRRAIGRRLRIPMTVSGDAK